MFLLQTSAAQNEVHRLSAPAALGRLLEICTFGGPSPDPLHHNLWGGAKETILIRSPHDPDVGNTCEALGWSTMQSLKMKMSHLHYTFNNFFYFHLYRQSKLFKILPIAGDYFPSKPRFLWKPNTDWRWKIGTTLLNFPCQILLGSLPGIVTQSLRIWSTELC